MSARGEIGMAAARAGGRAVSARDPVGAVRLLAELAAREGELVALTSSLVRARSENPPGDERAPVAVLRELLDATAGATTRVVAPEGAPARPSLVAAAGPRGTRTLLLAAHLDTVPAGGGWSREPFGGELDGGRLYGRGTSDNKGAAAAMAVAFRALVACGATERARLLLVANADEEAGGGLGMDVVRDALGEPVDAAVVGEPSGVAEPYETLCVAARGAVRFTLTAAGTGTHTSLVARADVVSAIELLLGGIAALRERVPLLRERHPRYGTAAELIVVRIGGGSGWGVVPAAASADVELRLVPGPGRDEVEAMLDAALAGSGVARSPAPGSLRWVAPSEVAADHPIVDAARAAWRSVLGVEPVLGCFPGGTDGRSLSERGIATIPGVGPGTLLRAHGPDEHVAVEELTTAARLYALTALTYLHDDRDTPGGAR